MQRARPEIEVLQLAYAEKKTDAALGTAVGNAGTAPLQNQQSRGAKLLIRAVEKSRTTFGTSWGSGALHGSVGIGSARRE